MNQIKVQCSNCEEMFRIVDVTIVDNIKTMCLACAKKYWTGEKKVKRK